MRKMARAGQPGWMRSMETEKMKLKRWCLCCHWTRSPADLMKKRREMGIHIKREGCQSMEARSQMKRDQMKKMGVVTIFSGMERMYHHQDMGSCVLYW